MPDNDTLLAYLASSFAGNTEGIATEAVRHIFDYSDACGVALNDVIQSGVGGINAVTAVKSQVLHADGTRPDLARFDKTATELVLIEVKSWAELTPNQANAYINRIPDDGPALVMFLATEDRIQVTMAPVTGAGIHKESVPEVLRRQRWRTDTGWDLGGRAEVGAQAWSTDRAARW